MQITTSKYIFDNLYSTEIYRQDLYKYRRWRALQKQFMTFYLLSQRSSSYQRNCEIFACGAEPLAW